MKILIVDDDKQTRMIMRIMAEARGSVAIEAIDGEDGLEKAAAHKPDLIISDALMPRMDGFAFLRRIRQDKDLHSTPFIFYSAVYTCSGEQEFGLSHGANAFIVKPKRADELWGDVEAVLRTTELQKETVETEPARIPAEEETYLKEYAKLVSNKLEEKVKELDDAVAARNESYSTLENTEASLRDALEEAQYRTMEVTALLKASKAVHENKEFDIAARIIFDAVREVIDAPAGYVALLNEDKQRSYLIYCLNPGGLLCSENLSIQMPVQGLHEVVYRTGKAVFVNNLPESQGMEIMPGGHASFGYVLFAPIVLNGKTVGLLGLAGKEGGFNNNDLKITTVFGEFLAIALNNYRTLKYIEASQKELATKNMELEKALQDLKNIQAQVLQQEKMATVGMLSAGVAHEVKNPLAIIVQGAEILESSVRGDDPSRMVVAEIKKAALRADKVVRGLMAFARHTPLKLEEANIADVMEETLSLVEHQFSLKNIVIERHFFVRALPNILIDGHQIGQVFMNILFNAADAMPEGGTIRITIDKTGASMRITVADTGIGIPDTELERIFDPFYSTKQKAGGVGLGLSVTKGIIENHQGSINVESTPGRGTSVIIELPFKQKKIPQ